MLFSAGKQQSVKTQGQRQHQVASNTVSLFTGTTNSLQSITKRCSTQNRIWPISKTHSLTTFPQQSPNSVTTVSSKISKTRSYLRPLLPNNHNGAPFVLQRFYLYPHSYTSPRHLFFSPAPRTSSPLRLVPLLCQQPLFPAVSCWLQHAYFLCLSTFCIFCRRQLQKT